MNTRRTMTPPLMLGNALQLFDNNCFGLGHVLRPALTPFSWPIVLRKQSIKLFSRGGHSWTQSYSFAIFYPSQLRQFRHDFVTGFFDVIGV